MNWDWEKLQQQQKKRSGQRSDDGGHGGNGGMPPQMDDMMNKLKDFNFSWLPILLIVLAILAVFFVSTMAYKVEEREVGVIRRFGEHIKTTYPGLHFKLPKGIDTLNIVNVEDYRREVFGLTEVTSYSTNRAQVSQYDESLMLTGDLNVAVVPWVVQYNIKDPVKFLFKVEGAEMLLRDLAEASMRLIVGDRSVNEVLFEREEIASECRKLLQKELKDAETGIRITNLELKKTNVPPKVQPSFNEVNKAEQEKETMIFTARKEYNQAIPAAKGEAEKMIRVAEGYALDRINRAEGDAAKFLALYEEYSKAKDVTRRRLYLEMAKDVFPKLGKKYIIDPDQKGLLPLLNLENKN